jgi:predicted NAD/FAD-binding protein
MGFAVSLESGRYEYSANGLLRLFGNLRNVVDPGHWRMLFDIIRFFRTGARDLDKVDDHMTLGAFVKAHGYSQEFLDRHLLPSAGAIWSSAPSQMLDYPAKSFLKFFDNHGLLKFRNRPAWRTVVGGSREYVKRMLADGRVRVLTGQPVKSVKRAETSVTIQAGDGFEETFDHVVIAAHADSALAMLDNSSPEERRMLGAFRYSRNRAVLHRDPALMPSDRWLWSSWNYLSQAGAESEICNITYWMNALQPLNSTTDFFVTLNPAQEPAAGTIERDMIYDHPIYNPETGKVQTELWSLQGKRRTWFCGSYFGAGFHEDGLQAGLAVAEQLGDVKRPWILSNPSTRIHVSRTSEDKPAMAGAAE